MTASVGKGRVWRKPRKSDGVALITESRRPVKPNCRSSQNERSMLMPRPAPQSSLLMLSSRVLRAGSPQGDSASGGASTASAYPAGRRGGAVIGAGRFGHNPCFIRSRYADGTSVCSRRFNSSMVFAASSNVQSICRR